MFIRMKEPAEMSPTAERYYAVMSSDYLTRVIGSSMPDFIECNSLPKFILSWCPCETEGRDARSA